MPIAGPSQPRRATITCRSIDPPPSTGLVAAEDQSSPRTTRPTSNTGTDRRLIPIGIRRAIEPRRSKHPTNSTPIHRSDRRRTRASIPERQLDLEDQPPPRCEAPSIPSSHRIRIRSRVGIELGASSVPSRCRIGRGCCGAAGGAGYRGRQGRVGCGCAAGCVPGERLGRVRGTPAGVRRLAAQRGLRCRVGVW
ncbi:hypothetical protein VIOLET_90 [Mycobacterium phage Violet]|uniref:Uncharacterized protein n=1 Tax=Mycobacterium phage Violet TaxID=1086800 RepID=G3MES5_9CAUD|nr:hypothetical protein VIOLET_90 [Mycobacterium phage Violet]AEO94483.1 hypothetical protein VIOLET_90 [Mycobacterium phage Violet]